MDNDSQKRIEHIMEILLEYTQKDFSNKLELSENNDEIDAVALGVNTIGEELGYYIDELESRNHELRTQQEELRQTNEELKEQQEELEAANEELEEQRQTIKENNNTLEEVNEELIQKAKRLKEANKYKSEFLANMSHELRSPLNSLLILSKDLSCNPSENLSEDELKSAEIIHQSGKELLALINDILDLSKIESGKMDLNRENVKIDKVADDLKRTFSGIAAKEGINFSVNIDEECPAKIVSDGQRFRQILKNFISNAIKFTTEGEVSVRFSPADSPDKGIKATVSDTGIGIPEDKREVIFDSFTQAEGGTSRRYGGTGLGLSIASELSTLLGGELQMESTPGEGSVFTVVLPLKPKTKAPSAAGSKPEFIRSEERTTGEEAACEEDNIILIIEDDPRFSASLKKQAEEVNMKPLIALSGKQGLSLAEKHVPDAIILEMNLPDMKGEEVLEKLAEHKKLEDIPVHVFSSSKKEDHEDLAIMQFLTKPVNKTAMNKAFGKIEESMGLKLKKLLLVEDHAITRLSIRKTLEAEGIKVLEAGTLSEARTALEEEVPDCIVLDMRLPDGNGVNLMKHFEDNHDTNLPPVIIYTGKELDEEEENELRSWAESIILKKGDSENRLLDEASLFLHQATKNKRKRRDLSRMKKQNRNEELRGKQILLADDDMRHVFAVSRVLSQNGAEILKASNGVKALELLQSDRNIDLVLMDIMMPDMDGYKTMKKIRGMEAYKDLPIIALTAKAMKDDRNKCMEAGASDYMSKPVDMNRLISLIRVWINQ